MGEKKRKLEKFKELHPFCCFCGGGVATESIEHALPRVFFRDKQRLKGLEFPACNRCNHGTSQLDQVASMVAITMGSALRSGQEDEYWKKLLDGVRNNNPEVLQYFTSETETISIKVRGLIRPFIRVKLDKKLFSDWLNPWGAKQGYALWYEKTGQILDEDASVSVLWVTNDQILNGFKYEDMFAIGEEVGFLKQGKLESSEQYFYRYALNSEHKLGFFALGTHDAAVCALFIVPKTMLSQLTAIKDKAGVFHTSAAGGIEPYSPEP